MTDENKITDEDLNKMVEEAEAESDANEANKANEAKIEELTNALARAMADMQNYKRRGRSGQERMVSTSQHPITGKEGLLRYLLSLQLQAEKK